VVTGKPAGDAGRTGDVSEKGTARLTANAPYRHEIALVLANDVSPVWSANNSRRYRRRVRCLRTRADSGMMSTCCSWREQMDFGVGIFNEGSRSRDTIISKSYSNGDMESMHVF
jgi:hypothetical protein